MLPIFRRFALLFILLVQPLPTLVYSAILTNEPITPALFIGGAIMLLGVYVGAFAPTRRPPVAEETSGSPV